MGALEVRIGVVNNPREIVFESALQATEILALVDKAFSSNAGLLSFTDERGRTILVPREQIAYLEVGVEEVRRVGFIA